MLRQSLHALLRGARRRAGRAGPSRFTPSLIALEAREVPAIVASFVPATGVLTVTGDANNNAIVVSRDAGGTLFVNAGAVAIQGGPATVANTTQISMFGLAGNDTLRLDQTNGALPAAVMHGGDGNDTMEGGSGADRFFGQAGNDSVLGRGGDDTAFLGIGNDVFTWNPGDGNDTIEGSLGFDRMQFNGANVNENVTLSNNGGRLRFTRDVANVTMDANDLERVVFEALGGTDNITVNNLSATDVVDFRIELQSAIGSGVPDAQTDTITLQGRTIGDSVQVTGQPGNISVTGLPTLIAIKHAAPTDQLLVNGNAGNDTIAAGTLPAGVISLIMDGGAGNDTLTGGASADVFLGGEGNDSIDGNQGNDVALMGAGDDLFIWNNGDGNDAIEGQAGSDALSFTGSNGDDQIDVSASGERVSFLRNIGSVTLDLNDLERIGFNALGGADLVTVNNLTGTDVTRVRTNFFAAPGQGPDGKQDTVSVNGTDDPDSISVSSVNGEVIVSELSAEVRFFGLDAGLDRLTVNGQAGLDLIDASELTANLTRLTMNGGLGEDIFIGSSGSDSVLGGDGDDTAFLGAGNDTFTWNPGDDNDVIEGQTGSDLMLFNGAAVAENITISADGGRMLFFRDIATVSMDTNDLERIRFNALGGADRIVINDLAATDVTDVRIDLASTLGGTTGDTANDAVVLNGTNGSDAITAATQNGATLVSGLSARVHIHNSVIANDQLQINGLAGNDTITAALLAVGTIQFRVEGGSGDDRIIGSAEGDVLVGGVGNDVIEGRAGDDDLQGAEGDDRILGGAGDDNIDGGNGTDSLGGGPGTDVLLNGEINLDP